MQNGDIITVNMVLTNTTGSAVLNVAPSTLTVTNGLAGATATGCSAPSPTTVTVPANGSATFSWTCTASVPANTYDSVTFTASAGNGTKTWSTSTSNSVIIGRPLTFQVTVNSPPGVPVATNTADLLNGGNILLASNPVNTAFTGSIGDLVWADLNGDGVKDPDEPGLAGVTVNIYDSTGTTVIGTAVTDGSGIYHVYNLPAATYIVRPDPATYPTGYIPSTATSLSVNLACPGAVHRRRLRPATASARQSDRQHRRHCLAGYRQGWLAGSG